jgi:hypothetical protein
MSLFCDVRNARGIADIDFDRLKPALATTNGVKTAPPTPQNYRFAAELMKSLGKAAPDLEPPYCWFAWNFFG